MTPELPFNFTYLFTAHLSLGAAAKPIPIPGGVRIIEHILNGTVTGPAINATIDSSLATPSVTSNGTIQVPVINVVGTTDDGFPFYIYEVGIGSPSAQVTRIVSVIDVMPFLSRIQFPSLTLSVTRSLRLVEEPNMQLSEMVIFLDQSKHLLIARAWK